MNLFPLWAYLQQPLFDSQRPFISNPHKFQQAYWLRRYLILRTVLIQHLKACWELETPFDLDSP